MVPWTGWCPTLPNQVALNRECPLDQLLGTAKALHTFRTVRIVDDELEQVGVWDAPHLDVHLGGTTSKKPDHGFCASRYRPRAVPAPVGRCTKLHANSSVPTALKGDEHARVRADRLDVRIAMTAGKPVVREVHPFGAAKQVNARANAH